MKRFFKTMISLLIVAVMMIQLFPVSLLITPAEAADVDGDGIEYYYERVSTPQPGKTYLIANGTGSAGSTVTVLGVPSGGGEGENVVTTNVTLSGTNIIPEFNNFELYEWEIVKGMPATVGGAKYGAATFMFHNAATGGYLFNPTYDDWTDTYDSDMRITLNPLDDDEADGTRIIFDYDAADPGDDAFIMKVQNTTYDFTDDFIEFHKTAGDPYVQLNLYGFSTDTYREMSLVYHCEPPTNITSSTTSAFYTDTTGGISGRQKEEQRVYWSTGTLNWNAAGGDLKATSNGGLNWYSSTNWKGNATSVYFDYYNTQLPSATTPMYVNSLIFFKNSYARTTVMYNRWARAWQGQGVGFYPSHRYPFCQFANSGSTSLNSGNTLANFGVSDDLFSLAYNYQYYYGWRGSSFVRQWESPSGLTGIQYYEKKTASTLPDKYIRISDESGLVDGGEYVICSSRAQGGNYATNGYVGHGLYIISSSSSSSDCKAGNKEAQRLDGVSYYYSTVEDGDVWKLVKTGDVFYLQNTYTGNILTTPSDETTDIDVVSQGTTGGAVDHGTHYVWTYDFSVNKLVAYDVPQNPGEDEEETYIGFSSGSIANDTCYLYKKCEHQCTTTVVSEATCTEDGSVTKTCSLCGATATETTAKLGHEYTSVVTDPTCTAQGYTTYTCQRIGCGYSYTADPVAATGHSYDDGVVTTAATCTTAGVKTFTCTKCQNSYTEAIAATGHTEVIDAAVAPTCTATGLTEGKHCSVCNTVLVAQETVAALDHDWQVTSTSGTCGEYGVTTYTCSRCSETKEEQGELIPHSYVATVTAPTCTEQGYTTYTCSKNCGLEDATYVDDYVDALGHDLGEWYTVTYATTTTVGEERRDCSRCDYYETQETPVLESAKLQGSTVETTSGQTVTIDFELRGNPGIWGMNFVIYWPEALTLDDIISSDDVFPLDFVEGNENGAVDPSSHETMGAYFEAAGIEYPERYMAIAYYVSNGAYENNHENGKIVSVSLTLPEGTCLNEYPVGVFGVYASTGDDVIDADGNSVPDFSYFDGKIIVTDGIECNHTNTITQGAVDATCTTNGYTGDTICMDCGMTVAEGELIEPIDHSYGNWYPVREASGLSAGIMRRVCSVCSHYEEEEFEAPTKTGISQSINDEEYIYHRTTRVYPGREYMFIGVKDGTPYAMGVENGNIVAQQVSYLEGDENEIASPADPSLIWSAAPGFAFSNSATGQWLNSSLVSSENVSVDYNFSNNLYLTDTPYENTSYSSFSHIDYDKTYTTDDLYWGFEDLYTTVAQAEGFYVTLADYALLKAANGGSYFVTDDDWYLSFDVSFKDENSKLQVYRDDLNSDPSQYLVDFGIEITPGNISLLGAGDPNYILSGNYTETRTGHQFGTPDSHGYNFTHWHNVNIVCVNNTITVYVDGVQCISQDNYDVSEGKGFCFRTENNTCGIDNIKAKVLHMNSRYTILINETFPTADEDGWSTWWDSYASASFAEIPDSNEATLLKENAFFASVNSQNSVYIYEKKLSSEQSMIYQLTDNLEGGESYVLVQANKAGSSTVLKASTRATEAIPVYEDGVSISPVANTYLPYIDLYSIGTENFYDNSAGTGNYKHEYGSAYEFFATEVEGGFFLNYIPADIQENVTVGDSYFLTAAGGATTTPSASNIITVTDGKVTIGSQTYYLYKKVSVDYIDTSFVNDVAVVDFGFGFDLDYETFFRENDTWTDRVDVTLTGLASGLSLQANNWFYPAGEKAKISGISTTAALTEGTATLSGETVSFANNGEYEDMLAIQYEGRVDRLCAYMYGTLYIIPATSVYYEDNTEGFITYTNSNNIPDGVTTGTWSEVGESDSVNYVLGSLYGNSTTHSSYLQYSGGSAHKVQVGAGNTPEDFADGWMPSASFTFTGTGFDVISAVGGATGVIFIEIDKEDGTDADNIIVDNYFGYTQDDEGNWIVDTEAETGIQLYQVPVINWESGSDTPATYTVKISVAYDSFFDHAGVGYSEFYLDGVRVYDPVDITTNEIARDKYLKDKELIISEENLRRLLITGGLLEGTNTEGVMFIDGNGLTNTTDAYDTYDEVGAANEITLPAAKGIAFTVTCSQIPDKVALGVKVATGSSGGTVQVSSGSLTAQVAVSTATDMYYDITSGVSWTQSGGEYTATLVITNNADVAISLTRIRLTQGTEEVVTADYSVDATTENIAYRTLALNFGVEGEELVIGDVRDTQTVNSADSLTLKKYLAGQVTLDNRSFAAADINGDGEVNARDAMLLKKLMVN